MPRRHLVQRYLMLTQYVLLTYASDVRLFNNPTYTRNLNILSIGFWGPEFEFAKIPGIVSTVVGYAGGKTDYPTYKSIQDHTEAIRLVYDPNVLTYEQILKYFFEMQGGPPQYNSYSRQYRSAILTHSDEQKRIAEKLIDSFLKQGYKKVWTDIEEATDFYRAEEYHQKYVVKQKSRTFF